MINVSPSTIAAAEQTLPPQRIGAGKRFFWMLFVVEAVVIATAFVSVMNVLFPARAPISASVDYVKVHEAILARLNGTMDDPLMSVAPGLTARASNVRGFLLNGTTYYYYLEGTQSFDPLSRQVVAQDQVEIVLRDDGGANPLVIYRLVSKEYANN